MQTNIQKWGNSLGIRIPMKLSRDLQLRSGSPVDIRLENNHLIISLKVYKLEDMLAQVNSKNCHHVLFDDEAQGEELL